MPEKESGSLLVNHGGALTAPEYEDRHNLVTVRELVFRGDVETMCLLRDQGHGKPSLRPLLWAGVTGNEAFADYQKRRRDPFSERNKMVFSLRSGANTAFRRSEGACEEADCWLIRVRWLGPRNSVATGSTSTAPRCLLLTPLRQGV